ncbi:MAG TPA: ABC transporter ATP-binding protein [Candidatus Saccharimonadales bacterium]|nr:ABC transporter ATP-binding protein [Candidatus Saccharimonadales bacterium]
MADRLLEVSNLRTYFYTEAGVVKAVDGISLDVSKSETVGLVGESGSGKSVTAQSILRIVPPPGRIVDGSIKFQGEDLLQKSEGEMRRFRGPKIAIVFQDPTSSLNPVHTVEKQLTDIITLHQHVSRTDATKKAQLLLERVGISEPEKRLKAYPHELSGGMKQRIAIARALSCEPSLLLADEPTTSLDVTIQAQVLEMLKQLQVEFEMSMVMITHDMGIVADLTERVTVAYAGKVMEAASTRDVFINPKHPYTEALLKAVPSIKRTRTLEIIPGNIPNLIEPPSGCVFHPRCKYAKGICSREIPALEKVEDGHYVACHLWRELSLEGRAN